MKDPFVRSSWVAAIWLLLFLNASCSRTPVEDYSPANAAEEEIHTVVLQFLSVKKDMDADALLRILHEKGVYQFAHWRWMSKATLRRRLPQFWKYLASGDHRAFPMCRENLTGDFLPSGRYFNPKIVVEGESAKISLVFSVGIWGLGHDISMRRENGRWWIVGLKWQQN